MGLKERFNSRLRFAIGIAKLIVKVANKKLNLAYLERKYKASRGKILDLHITDIDFHKFFRVKDGVLSEFDSSAKVDGGMEMSSEVLLAVLRGRLKVKDSVTGKGKIITPYEPLDAWRYGDLEIWGEATTNDALLFFGEAWPEVIEEIRPYLSGEKETED